MGKISYGMRNWSQYNKSLVHRGDITFWFDEDMTDNWSSPPEQKGRGRPQEYSDTAIECFLTLRLLFQLPLRGAQGFLQGLIKLAGLGIKSPDYSLVSKRASSLKLSLKKFSNKEPLHVVVDSTGLKIFGEGEWKTRCHGKSKRRSWRKVHLAVDSDTHTIVGYKLTEHTTHDCEVIDDILPNNPLKEVCADGAYDNQKSYDAIEKRGAIPLIPPRSGACLNKNPPSMGMVMRNQNVEASWAIGRDNWKKGSNYHQRSLAETAMFRLKKILGTTVSARKIENQDIETLIKVNILNKMTSLGMPERHRKV